MNIQLTKAGKKYGNNWVFRNVSNQFDQGKKYVVLGPNGSGKSTLLKTISGGATLSEGIIEYTLNNAIIKPEEVFHHISIAAPWLDLPEEYSLEEIIAFHTQFKQFSKGITVKDSIKIIGLEHTHDKHYQNFSSGMKQRVKLGLAILTDAPTLLLDEPVTALDAKSIQWYQELIKEYANEKTIIVFSNHRQEEYGFCNEQVQLVNNL